MTFRHDEGLPIGRDHHAIGEGQSLGHHSRATLRGDEQNRAGLRRALTENVPHVANIGSALPIDDQIVVGIVHQRRQVNNFDQLAVFES